MKREKKSHRIILVTGWFDIFDKHGFPSSKKEFVASHGIDEMTGDAVIVQCVHPRLLGAVFDSSIGEYVIDRGAQ